jgi:hypothetical protein
LARLMRSNYELGFNKVEDFERARAKALFKVGRSFGLSEAELREGFFGKTPAHPPVRLPENF